MVCYMTLILMLVAYLCNMAKIDNRAPEACESYAGRNTTFGCKVSDTKQDSNIRMEKFEAHALS